MSDAPDKSNFGATSHIAELEIKWEHYGFFKNVNDSEYKLEIEVANDKCLVKKPGIYKLVSKDHLELYVGEGQSVHKRLSDYKNARYELQEKNEYTNRRIQGWMLNLINKGKGPIEIWICTEAPRLFKKKLDLEVRFDRKLIEHLEIAIRHKNFRVQNDPKNWEPRPQLSQVKTE
jgi:hypothetical protein